MSLQRGRSEVSNFSRSLNQKFNFKTRCSPYAFPWAWSKTGYAIPLSGPWVGGIFLENDCTHYALNNIQYILQYIDLSLYFISPNAASCLHCKRTDCKPYIVYLRARYTLYWVLFMPQNFPLPSPSFWSVVGFIKAQDQNSNPFVVTICPTVGQIP